MTPFRNPFKKKNAGTAVQTCPLHEWRLEVTVTRTASPPLYTGGVTIELDDGGVIDFKNAAIGNLTSAKADFDGDQQQDLTISADLDDDSWYAVATTNVTVVLGQKKMAALQLKPKPWIKFKVWDNDAKVQLAGLTLSFTLPSGKQTPVTTANATCDAMKLDPTDNTCSADEIDNTVDAEVWEFVKIESA